MISLSIFLKKIILMLKALITGITGQDGAYLAKLLLEKGYSVYGIHKKGTLNFGRLKELLLLENPNLYLFDCDISEFNCVRDLVKKLNPDEIYNLAAYSFVADSHQDPLLLHKVTASAPINFIEVIRITNTKIKLFQASSSEIFGDTYITPQNENVLLNPRNPYGMAKAYAHKMLESYRLQHNIFVVIGILYNHESPLRDVRFVTRKITYTVAKIFTGKDCVLEIGNLNAIRDWGYAPDYVDGIWESMQHKEPNTYVFATGRETSVRDFISMSFQSININVLWRGTGVNECGYDIHGRVIVRVSEKYYREDESVKLIGDASKAYDLLNWKPTLVLEELCKLMVNNDIDKEKKEVGFK
jgi:GDPmannose 4,6-dehydratase